MKNYLDVLWIVGISTAFGFIGVTIIIVIEIELKKSKQSLFFGTQDENNMKVELPLSNEKFFFSIKIL